LSSAGRARAARDDVKKATISREAVGCNEGFGGLARRSGLPPVYADHPGTEPRGTTGVD